MADVILHVPATAPRRRRFTTRNAKRAALYVVAVVVLCVVIVPLNLGVRASSEVEPGVDPVWRELLAHFAAQEQPATALERNSASALWVEVMKEVQSKPEPDVYKAYAMFVEKRDKCIKVVLDPAA